MSEPILPLPTWPEGIEQPDIVFNDLAIRLDILNGLVINDTTSAQPGSPDDGDIYILSSSPTGSQWAEFDQYDLAIFKASDDGGTWYAFAPSDGIVVNLAGALVTWDGAEYVGVGSGPSGGSRSTVTAVTSSSGVVTLDYSLGDYFTLTLSENVTSWVISNGPGSGKGFSLMVQITQAAGAYTVAKPGTTAGGAALDVSTGNGDVDLLAITSFNNGTTLRSTIAKDFS